MTAFLSTHKQHKGSSSTPEESTATWYLGQNLGNAIQRKEVLHYEYQQQIFPLLWTG